MVIPVPKEQFQAHKTKGQIERYLRELLERERRERVRYFGQRTV